MKPPLEHGPAGTPQDWLMHAESDLNLARVIRERADVLPEQACFHAQQAAEKALKAVLLFNGIDFPLIHDIEELLELAKQNKMVPPQEVSDASALTPYAVEARYPGHVEQVTPSDVDEAIHLAESVLRWASEILGG